MDISTIEVFVERLDNDMINEHLRTSTLCLQEIMSQDSISTEHRNLESLYKPLKKNIKKRVPKQRCYCSICGKIYKNRNTMQNHILLEHSDTEKSKCSQCDKLYPSRLSLNKHTRYMHLRHRCAVCYKTFEHAQLLSQHSEACKKVQMACEVCGNFYGSPVSLRNHVKYKHPSKTGHWCALCRRGYVSEEKLINHRSTVHPTGATVCSCGQQFPTLAQLRSHELYKHTLDSHKCRHCHKAFATGTRLQRHLARLHYNR